MNARHTIAFALVVLLAGCGSKSERIDDAYSEGYYAAEARAQTATYSSLFGTEACGYDCSGHEAGFAWAREKRDFTGCETHGDDAFTDGCKAYFKYLDNGGDELRTAEEDKGF